MSDYKRQGKAHKAYDFSPRPPLTNEKTCREYLTGYYEGDPVKIEGYVSILKLAWERERVEQILDGRPSNTWAKPGWREDA